MVWIGNKHRAVFMPSTDDGSRGAHSEQRLGSKGSMVARARTSIRPAWLSGHDAKLNVECRLALPEVAIRVLFRRKRGDGTGAGAPGVETPMTIVPAGRVLGHQDQIALANGTNDPLVWVQLLDAREEPLSQPICIGRCGQGSGQAESVIPIPVLTSAWVSARECSDVRGPVVECSGEVEFVHGIVARLLFGTSCNQFGGPHQALSAADVVIVPAGTTVHSPSRLLAAGVGGNRWVSVVFSDPSGDVPEHEVPVGQCIPVAQLRNVPSGGLPRRLAQA